MSQHDDGGITVVDVSDPAVRALPIPLWVPTAVARSIRTKYAKDLHELADLARDALAEEGRDRLCNGASPAGCLQSANARCGL